jgi:tetratricopeptide (TPR) repeat protein
MEPSDTPDNQIKKAIGIATSMQGEKMKEKTSGELLFWGISAFAAVVSVFWCLVLGAWNAERVSLIIATVSASFAIGSLIGFVFSIFGDEIEPFGKLRDAFIALASGIAGLSIAKVNEIGSKIGEINLFGHDSQQGEWFSALFVATYTICGFYFMYLLRKLILNPALAEARVVLDRIQTSGRIGKVAIDLAKKLPQRVLLGRQVIPEDEDEWDEEEKTLRSELTSEVVESFLSGCEKVIMNGSEMSPDDISKAAILYYYRSYFEEDESSRKKKIQQAIDWISLVLNRDPLNLEFQIKLADIYGLQDRYDEAVSIFERLERDDNSPQYVQQWLGYFLLFIDGREKDAIKHSLSFHDRFPDESSGLFNAACGYAQLYERELRAEGIAENADSENRKQSLKILEWAIRIDPECREAARKHSEPDSSFAALENDGDFLRLTESKL